MQFNELKNQFNDYLERRIPYIRQVFGVNEDNIKIIEKKLSKLTEEIQKEIHIDDNKKKSWMNWTKYFNIKKIIQFIEESDIDTETKVKFCDEAKCLLKERNSIRKNNDEKEKIQETYPKIIDYLIEGRKKGEDIHIPPDPHDVIRRIRTQSNKNFILGQYINILLPITKSEKQLIRVKFSSTVIILFSELLNDETKKKLKSITLPKGEEEELKDIIAAFEILLKDKKNEALLLSKNGRSLLTPRIKRLIEIYKKENSLEENDEDYIKKKIKEIQILPSFYKLNKKNKDIIRNTLAVPLDDNDIYNMIKILYFIEKNETNFIKNRYVKKLFPESFIELLRIYNEKKITGVSELSKKQIKLIKDTFISICIVLASVDLNENSKKILERSCTPKNKGNYYNNMMALLGLVNNVKFLENHYTKRIMTKKFINKLINISYKIPKSLQDLVRRYDEEDEILDMTPAETSTEDAAISNIYEEKIISIIKTIIEVEFPLDDYDKEKIIKLNKFKDSFVNRIKEYKIGSNDDTLTEAIYQDYIIIFGLIDINIINLMREYYHQKIKNILHNTREDSSLKKINGEEND